VKNTYLLILSWLLVGIIASTLGFIGGLYRPAALILLLPLAAVINYLWGLRSVLSTMNRQESFIGLTVMFVWLLHLSGVFVPETGFDAVWYHLPVVNQFVAEHAFTYIPELYQSLNPLFSDSIFLLGFLGVGEMGTKLVAYGLTLSLALMTYQLACQFLNRQNSLWSVLMISTFQVVSWQASSFYIDTTKAFWEVAALWVLLQEKQTLKKFAISGALYGAVIASKAFNLVLLPVMLVTAVIASDIRRVKSVAILIAIGFLLALPFYVRTYWFSGDALLALTLPAGNLQQIAGQETLFDIVIEQLQAFPNSMLVLSLWSSDYITFSLLLLLPFLIWYLLQHWREKPIQILGLWTVSQYLLWWFVPPLSTRYALSGFISLFLLEMVAVESWVKHHPHYQRALELVLVIAIAFNILPRLLVTVRNLNYILGQQTKFEYLQQFNDGSIDQHLSNWHRRKD